MTTPAPRTAKPPARLEPAQRHNPSRPDAIARQIARSSAKVQAAVRRIVADRGAR